MKISKLSRAWLLVAALMGLNTGPSAAAAGTRIAVLDFELNDLAGVIPTPQEELERTASLAPLLRDALSKKEGYMLIPIGKDEQTKANAGHGYLYDHPDEAAKLGNRFGADLVVVGLIHKPSFLFAYVKVRLVNAKSQKPLGERTVEVKGSAKKITERGIMNLADQIDDTVKRSDSQSP
jgi:hypothetical protein